MSYTSKYTIELVNGSGVLLADLGGRASNRQIVMSRNQPEQITWSLNLDDFEKYCSDNNIDALTLIKEGYTEVRVKRLGTYIAGGQIFFAKPQVNATSQTYDITAYGFLKLFEKRYTGATPSGTVLETYTAANGNALSRQDLAWTLINQSQALTNGNYGITRGVTNGSTSTYDKTYSRTNLKDALQDITKLQTNPIDIEFTYNKVFNCYAQIGSTHPEIVFEYPTNILDIAAPRDATNLSNEVIAVGQGAGAGQVVRYADDTTSQVNRYLRQEVVLSSGTDDANGAITNDAAVALATYSTPNTIPAITIDGNQAPYITDYHIGDIVTVKATGYKTMAYINGLYRIETITLNLDDSDSETITLEVSAT